MGVCQLARGSRGEAARGRVCRCGFPFLAVASEGLAGPGSLSRSETAGLPGGCYHRGVVGGGLAGRAETPSPLAPGLPSLPRGLANTIWPLHLLPQ